MLGLHRSLVGYTAHGDNPCLNQIFKAVTIKVLTKCYVDVNSEIARDGK